MIRCIRKTCPGLYLGVLSLFLNFLCQSAFVKKGGESELTTNGGEPVPRKFKSIYFLNFSNESFSGELTGEIRDMLSQKLSLQQRFRIEPDREKADIVLYGKIEYYKLAPREIDEFGRVTRYTMTGIVTIWVRPNPAISEENILDKKIVRYDTFYSPEIPPFETEFTARQRLVEGLCDRIVETIVTGWYSKLKSNEELGYDPAEQKSIFGN